MTRQVTATEAKATILALLDVVAAGEEVEITKRGKLVARLVPVPGSHGLRGRLAGRAASAVDEDELFSTGLPWEVGACARSEDPAVSPSGRRSVGPPMGEC